MAHRLSASGRLALTVASVAAAAAFLDAAFCPTVEMSARKSNTLKRCSSSLDASANPLASLSERASSFWEYTLSELAGEGQGSKAGPTAIDDKSDQIAAGKVTRTAARAFRQDGASKPSSPRYTTRKDAVPQVTLTESGVDGDYNHYRTQALKSTPDRAISILTADVMASLRDEGPYRMVHDGDLGENILVDGVGYRFFEVGRRYRFSEGGNSEECFEKDGVVVQITEPMVPCANLCKLPYINNSDLKPAERIKRCQDFLDRLGRADGIRGWYAKVIGGGGTVRLGDQVTALV